MSPSSRSNSQEPNLEHLQSSWREIYQKTLPSASALHPEWPVHLDHCFARIILDNAIGVDKPWTEEIKSPAWKHMSKEQLERCIELAQKILDGEVDLVVLDGRSLGVRGKGKGKGNGLKRKRGDEDEEPNTSKIKEKVATSIPISPKEDLTPYLKKIALSTSTPFQKSVLKTLCQVPRGRYTTYGAMAKHLSSSPRAVGNALRNNPFAPHVPCHRVLASGGGLGGFHGSWGRNGEEGLWDGKKRELLRGEGVRFDGRGRVVGGPWVGFR